MPRFVEDNSDLDSSDSDDDYTENEKILLGNVRSKQFKDSDSEAEVFGVGSASEEDEDDKDEQSDIALSDVEGQDDDKFAMPDVRAWGKQKSKFYSTDYVDPDYGGFQGKDAHLAELEEEEARNLQQQLAQQLDDDDFALDIFSQKKKEDDDKETEELIKSDLSKLSSRQKLQLLQKEAPEFFGLVDDFEEKMTIAKDYLAPILKKYKKGEIPNTSAIDFVTTQQDLILNYCVNIYMYLLLRASKTNVQNHPVVKRLYQYRQLLAQLMPVFEEVIKPQIEDLLKEKQEEKPKKTLNIVSKLTEKNEKKKTKKRPKETEEGKSNKKVKFDDTVVEHEIQEEKEEISSEQHMQEPEEKGTEEVGKRAITYQIAKNKGLTPHRKKEQRNPRVKHRNKFRKAQIRRRGAIRESRTEMSRYGGEVSGIKATVSKSIKIKS